MTYTTKFNLGQPIFYIQGFDSRRLVKCRTCSQAGTIRIGDEEFACPKCNGRSAHAEHAGRKWIVDWQTATVGQIEIIDTNRLWSNEQPRDFPTVKYMISTHGVRGGWVINESELFATKEDAQAECDRRNHGVVFADEDGANQVDPAWKP